MSALVERVLHGVAAFGLDHAAAAAGLPAEPLGDDAWRELMMFVANDRLAGLLMEAILSGAFAATESQHEEASLTHRSVAAGCLMLERRLVGIVRDLHVEGVELRVLKGPAVAHLDYPDPALRTFGDIDLLVRADGLAAAARKMSDMGGTRHYAEPRPGFDRRFSKGLSFELPDATEVDLHRTLAAGPFGLTIDLSDLFERPDHIFLAGEELPVLPRDCRFLHACLHAVLGSSRPHIWGLRDVAQIAPGDNTEAAMVVDRAARWQALAVVHRAVGLAERTLAWDPPAALTEQLRTHPAPRRELRWLDAYTRPDRTYARLTIYALGALPGWRDRLAYGMAIAFPAPAPGTRARSERWRRGVRALVRR